MTDFKNPITDVLLTGAVMLHVFGERVTIVRAFERAWAEHWLAEDFPVYSMFSETPIPVNINPTHVMFVGHSREFEQKDFPRAAPPQEAPSSDLEVTVD